MAHNDVTQTEVMLSTPESAKETPEKWKSPECTVFAALLKPITQPTISSSFKEQVSLASPAEAKPSAQHWGLGASGSVGTLQLNDSANPEPPSSDVSGFNWRGDNRMEAVGKK